MKKKSYKKNLYVSYKNKEWKIPDSDFYMIPIKASFVSFILVLLFIWGFSYLLEITF